MTRGQPTFKADVDALGILSQVVGTLLAVEPTVTLPHGPGLDASQGYHFVHVGSGIELRFEGALRVRILSEVVPTAEQLRILGDSGPGFRLIRGAAGSGKTTTALLRLKQLCRSRLARRARLGHAEPVRVLVLTYNRTLEGYVAELARSQVEHGPGLLLEVSTFGRWARGFLDQVDILDQRQIGAILRPLLDGIGVRQQRTEFFVDEVDYALSRFLPADLAHYLTIRRDGRGTTPRVERALRQRILDEVIPGYQAAKQARGVLDWNDVSLLALEARGPTFDVVIVDEAQDFAANQVRALIAHLTEDHSTTFVLDAVQRIYPRFFAWSEVGIHLRPPEVYRLAKNYRNTAQIAAFARPLVAALPSEDDGTLPDFSACQENGEIPKVVAGTYSRQIDYMLAMILEDVDLTAESVAFLQPRGGAWFDYVREALHRRGVPFCELTRQSTWPTGPEAVAVCTIHSAKGLEFDHVMLPGLNQQVTPHGSEEGDASLDQLRRLLAMGVGRARKTVTVGYKPGEQSTLIGLLDSSTYDLVRL
ncbi:MAG: 3'-5' exonuclease [Gaiellales bacterium]